MRNNRWIILLTLALGLILTLAFMAISSQAAISARSLPAPADQIIDSVVDAHSALAISPDNPKIITATLNVRAYIDGRSSLVVQDDAVYWFHMDALAPGRHGGMNAPTYLNGAAWYPGWPDIPDPANAECYCFSSTYWGIPALALQDQSVSLDIVQARYSVSITQQPQASNDYTLVIEFNDFPLPGPEWYEIDIVYTTYDYAHLIPPTQASFGAASSTVSYTVQLANQTGASDTFNLALGSHVWDTEFSDDSLGPLAHGDVLTFTVYVTIPINAPWFLADTVAITATSVSHPTVYTDTVSLTSQVYGLLYLPVLLK